MPFFSQSASIYIFCFFIVLPSSCCFPFCFCISLSASFISSSSHFLHNSWNFSFLQRKNKSIMIFSILRLPFSPSLSFTVSLTFRLWIGSILLHACCDSYGSYIAIIANGIASCIADYRRNVLKNHRKRNETKRRHLNCGCPRIAWFVVVLDTAEGEGWQGGWSESGAPTQSQLQRWRSLLPLPLLLLIHHASKEKLSSRESSQRE